LLFYVMRCGGTNAAVPLASSAVASEAADSRLPFRGGTVSAELRLPKSLPEGHARLLVVPSRRLRTDADRRVFRPGAAVPARYLARIESHADVALSVPLYVRGTRLTRLESLLKEARDAFYGADASTIVSFWGQAPIRYPEGKDPQRFSAVFGAKKTIERAESILKRAENRASLLDDLPLFEEDLRRRLDALKQNRLPERGVLWRAYKSTVTGSRTACTYRRTTIPRSAGHWCWTCTATAVAGICTPTAVTSWVRAPTAACSSSRTRGGKRGTWRGRSARLPT